MIPAPHLNEHLKRVLPKIGHAAHQKVVQATQTPYLVFDAREGSGLSKQDLEVLHLVDDGGLLRTPFPMFRFCVESTKGKLFGFCERTEAALAVVALHKERAGMGKIVWGITFKGYSRDKIAYDGRIYDQHTLDDVTNVVDEARRETDDVMPTGDIKEYAKTLSPVELRAFVQKLRKVAARQELAADSLQGQVSALETFHEMMSKQSDDILGLPADHFETFLAIYGMLMILCYEYFVPHNFMARVTPDKPGKSVEWLRAREHYTVIHRHHPANSAEVKDGARVAEGNHSQRIAHSRRAHTKLLTHPRWKNSVGKRVFVRASWVGPKEWKDTAGQTYTIVLPEPERIATVAA